MTYRVTPDKELLATHFEFCYAPFAVSYSQSVNNSVKNSDEKY